MQRAAPTSPCSAKFRPKASRTASKRASQRPSIIVAPPACSRFSPISLFRGRLQLNRSVVVLLTEGSHRREEFRTRRLSSLFELPGLTLVTPALRTQASRFGEVRERVVAMTLFEEVLTHSEVGRCQRGGIVRTARSASNLIGRERIFALIALIDPVSNGIQVSSAQPLPLGDNFVGNLEGRQIHLAHSVGHSRGLSGPYDSPVLIDPNHHRHIDDVI